MLVGRSGGSGFAGMQVREGRVHGKGVRVC